MLDRERTEPDEDSSASVDRKPTLGQLDAFGHLVKSGLIPTVEENAKRLTAPFSWYAPELQGRSRTIGGGTVCFVNTGVRLLGLTAAHIHRACMTALECDPDLGCQIGGHSFQPSKHLIDIDHDLDLATYELSEIQVNAAGADVHAPSTWPPRLTDDDDLVLIGGWPWRSVVERIGSSTHDFVFFIGRSAGASESSLGMATFRSTSIPYGTRSLSPDLNLGGMSGGPMYVLKQGLIARLELVGILFEYSPSPLELMLARPLSRIAADGKLIRDAG